MEEWGEYNINMQLENKDTDQDRYASEYHVERYLRECFIPRIAPVSRVCVSRIT